MSATMSDNLSIPFTVMKQTDHEPANAEKDKQCLEQCRWKSLLENHTLVIEVENIKLVQAPSETLNMRVKIAREKDAYDRPSTCHIRNSYGGYTSLYHHNYYIELRFLNYLHEFNQNHRYEIVCKIADSGQQKDEHLFSCTELRLAACVESGKRFVATNRDLPDLSKNLYFCIRRRFNGSNDMMDNQRVYINARVISTLKNTGCDVVLEAKDGVIRTHKSILSQNSEVFQTMLSVDMKEKQSGVIDVSDFEKRVVVKMLDYFYTGEVGELGDMTEELFKLAHRYQLHDLCRRCEDYYTFYVKVDNDNIVEILKLTEIYGLENLNECAVNFTKRHEQELTMLPKYREYLIQSINLSNATNMLVLAMKYGLKDVKMECFDFIKDNYLDMMENEDFLNLFESDARLMKEIHVYVHKKKL